MISKGSFKSPRPMSVCGDCGALGPSWASINRGILLCSDCCSVHRTLGRHVSHIKALRQSNWIPEQLHMVQSLYANGANSIWEYSLLNPHKAEAPSSNPTSKPQASDPLHPLKFEFIRAKHATLAFLYKPTGKDEFVTESELSRQLHSSVRTSNLETSLRLLSQGADPNYYHPEKNSTPLMVAGRAGQAGQVELLLVYGADPGAVDKSGKSATDYAKTSGHNTLSQRIFSSQFELSDRLTYYLCQKRPEHISGQHFLIPESDRSQGEAHRIAKRKLQGLNNSVFEELAIDVYDEVDRRETDSLWASNSNSPGNKSAIIPFLPVNPDYGTTRNQGRQKLARLNSLEFAGLVIDVLKEVRRRQTELDNKWPLKAKTTPSQRIKSLAFGGDEEPIYDHVASDDDYYQVPEDDEDELVEKELESCHNNNNANNLIKSKKDSISNRSGGGPHLSGGDYIKLKTQLESSELRVQHLIDSNDDMRSEIARLTTTVNKLILENKNLRVSPIHSKFEDSRSLSMYESRSPPPPSSSSGVPQLNSYLSMNSSHTPRGNTSSHYYGNDVTYDEPTRSYSARYPSNYYDDTSGILPSQEEVVRRTEAITRCIQELLITAKDEKFDAFIPCSERIVRAVTDMVVLFPDDMGNESMRSSLSSLTSAAQNFERECGILVIRSQKEGPLSSSFVSQQVIQNAFDIAKSTKQLVAFFQ
ncbi:ARF GTPase-activating protein GIT2 [Lepeophtheirus salmonis]|uniref:ARF GTPase-activating protein GIT2 n=1 Tax=Lepeophtheirus salmonis TaxID=72036 RepID=UPI001AE737BB|nr:ARF GTPase-activating protein GIT1-like [Lepeophtheirus salmonis]